MTFNIKATIWLGVYLDKGLQFRDHKNLPLEMVRKTDNRVQHLTAKRGLALVLIRRIQVAAV